MRRLDIDALDRLLREQAAIHTSEAYHAIGHSLKASPVRLRGIMSRFREARTLDNSETQSVL